MPDSTDNEMVALLLKDIRSSGEKDKTALRKESKDLRVKLEAATATILDLSVQNKGLIKDVCFFRSTKWSREIGALVLAICGLTVPIIPDKYWLDWYIVYYCVVTCAAISVAWGVWYSWAVGCEGDKKPSSPEN